jgi:hypothetical protein
MNMNFKSLISRAIALAPAILIASFGAAGMANAQPSMQQQQFQQAAGGLQTIQVMDPQVGLPAMTIAIPQGWTHQFQSIWNKNSDPMVSFSFEAQEPGGAGKFYMIPMQNFYDIPQLYGQTPFFQKPMPPRQAFEYMLNLASQKDPKFRAMGYRIVQFQDAPPVNVNGSRSSTSTILAEFTENGAQKQEVVDVIVTVSPKSSGTTWSLFWYGLQDRKGLPPKTLADRLAAISRTVQILPQWRQQQVAFSAQGSAEVIAKSNAIRDQGNAMTRQLEAQSDAARQANMASFRRRMESKERVTNMTVEAIKKENVYRDSSGRTFTDSNNPKHIWTNPNNDRKIYSDDSTYNPNADNRVNNVQWGEAQRVPR